MGVWIDVEKEILVRKLLAALRRAMKRGHRELSQRKIALHVGVSRGTVSSIATGKIGWPARGIKPRRRSLHKPYPADQEVEFEPCSQYRCEAGHLTTIRPCPICLAQQARAARLAVG